MAINLSQTSFGKTKLKTLSQRQKLVVALLFVAVLVAVAVLLPNLFDGEQVDNTKSDYRTSEAWIAARPAYPHLPHMGQAIYISVSDDEQGVEKPVFLNVQFTGFEEDATAEYRNFLATHGDYGAGYEVNFEKVDQLASE